MGGSTHVTFTAGAVVFAGGLFAFIKKNSKASLIASSVIAGALVAGGVITQSGNDFLGHSISLASSASLASFGLYRFASSGKPFPSLPLLLLGASVAAYESKKVIEWM